MKLTALIENKSDSNLLSEHGLAIHIEYGEDNYLLDTGASNQFVENANKLGIDLSKIKTAFLSHSHFDHSGGYDLFFKKNETAKVYLQEEAKEQCYCKVLWFKQYVGTPKGIQESYPDRFCYINEDTQIEPGVWAIRHSTQGLAIKGKQSHFYRKLKNKLVPDDLLHEQSIVFEGKDGLVILNSCCHAGVDHVVEEVKKSFPGRPIQAMIGGFHLMGLMGPSSKAMSKKKIQALGHRLVELGVERIYTCHCTGNPAYAILKETLGDKVNYFKTGDVIELR